MHSPAKVNCSAGQSQLQVAGHPPIVVMQFMNVSLRLLLTKEGQIWLHVDSSPLPTGGEKSTPARAAN